MCAPMRVSRECECASALILTAIMYCLNSSGRKSECERTNFVLPLVWRTHIK